MERPWILTATTCATAHWMRSRSFHPAMPAEHAFCGIAKGSYPRKSHGPGVGEMGASTLLGGHFKPHGDNPTKIAAPKASVQRGESLWRLRSYHPVRMAPDITARPMQKHMLGK